MFYSLFPISYLSVLSNKINDHYDTWTLNIFPKYNLLFSFKFLIKYKISFLFSIYKKNYFKFCAIEFLFFFFVFFEKTTPALEIYTLCHGGVQIYMKGTQRTDSEQQSVSYTKCCPMWFESTTLDVVERAWRSLKRLGQPYSQFFIILYGLVVLLDLVRVLLAIKNSKHSNHYRLSS